MQIAKIPIEPSDSRAIAATRAAFQQAIKQAGERVGVFDPSSKLSDDLAFFVVQVPELSK